MRRWSSLLVLISAACTDVPIEVVQPEVTRNTVDNELTLLGSYCASPAGNVDYPVKVMFIVDGSGSQQFTDQNRQRARAVEDVINALIGTGAAFFKIMVFNSSVMATPPVAASGCDVFTHDNLVLANGINDLAIADTLTDYQGVLSVAYAELQRDMDCVLQNRGQAELGRTKYVVIFISDGLPDPQCSVGPCNDFDVNFGNLCSAPCGGTPNINCLCESTTFSSCLLNAPGTVCDAGQYGTCLSGAAGCAFNDQQPYCCQNPNSALLFGNAVGSELAGGADYNQPYQILQKIVDIMELADRREVGELRVHSGLVLDPLADPAIIAIFGDVTQARPMMQQVAEIGNGNYLEFYGGDEINFLNINFQSVKQHRVVRALFADNRAARLRGGGLQPDTDFDGLTDDEEFAAGTRPTRADSDNDGYSDLVEVRMRGFGFDPEDPCLPPIDDSTGASLPRSVAVTCTAATVWTTPNLMPCASSCTLGYSCGGPSCTTDWRGCDCGGACDHRGFLDVDRDGLHDCEERALGTSQDSPDTDRDGIPDPVELTYGLDPLRWDSDRDDDNDTIPNAQEIEWHLHPLIKQNEEQARERYRYDRPLVGTTLDGRSCYDFAVRRIKLAYTLDSEDLPATRPGVGHNEIRLYLLENLADNLAGTPLVRVACVRAQYIPPSLKVPATGEVTLADDPDQGQRLLMYLSGTDAQFANDLVLFDDARDCIDAQ